MLRLGRQQPLAHTAGPRAVQTTGAQREQLLSCCGTWPGTLHPRTHVFPLP